MPSAPVHMQHALNQLLCVRMFIAVWGAKEEEDALHGRDLLEP